MGAKRILTVVRVLIGACIGLVLGFAGTVIAVVVVTWDPSLSEVEPSARAGRLADGLSTALNGGVVAMVVLVLVGGFVGYRVGGGRGERG